MRRAAVVALCLWGIACGPPTTTTTTPPTPPQAFLTVNENYVIGTSVKGTVSTSGCAKVVQVQLLEQGSFLMDTNYKGQGTAWELNPATLVPYYSARGLAVPLTLSAKVVCDDGRTNTSQPVGVTFMPVTSVFQPEGGAQAAPDGFIAEGGLGGTATTFVGCVGTATGLGLARVDTQGQIVAMNDALPFACSASSQITEKSTARQTRWLMEPGVGAFAFDSSLNVTAIVPGKTTYIGVSKDGDALITLDTTPQDSLVRANPKPTDPNQAIRWTIPISGIMNASPIIDAPTDTIIYATWEYSMGGLESNFVAHKGFYATGHDKSAPVVMLKQTYQNSVDIPITPYGAFNADGSLFYVPLLGFNVAAGTTNSTVLACATNAAGCTGPSRRWASAPFDGVISTVSIFGGNANLFAVGPLQAYFLAAVDGSVKSLGGAAIKPTGSQYLVGVQPGLGTDIFLLSGPIFGEGVPAYPNEVIAIDAPERGELYRFTFGGGDTPLGSIAMAVDEGGQAWYRVGTKLVKPQTLAAYRSARGATASP